MKIRNGFVSNSSSTAFIIRVPENKRHLMHYNYVTTDTDYAYRPFGKFEEDVAGFIADGYIKVDENEHAMFFEKPIKLSIANDLSRKTSIAFGKELINYMNLFKEEDWYGMCEKIQSAIDDYGLEEVMFLRQSDECIGGELPKELDELLNIENIIYEFEYH